LHESRHARYGQTYWHPVWQKVFAPFHSIPLAVVGWLIAGCGGWVSAQTVFLSMVLHSLFDLPVHNTDAHRHFFPLSNYRFRRPISYWDVKRHGAIVALVELFLVLAATLYILPRTQSLTGQGLLAIINIIYATGYFWFYLQGRVPVRRARSHKKPGFLKKPGFGNH
jgi:hypothetical protein